MGTQISYTTKASLKEMSEVLIQNLEALELLYGNSTDDHEKESLSRQIIFLKELLEKRDDLRIQSDCSVFTNQSLDLSLTMAHLTYANDEPALALKQIAIFIEPVFIIRVKDMKGSLLSYWKPSEDLFCSYLKTSEVTGVTFTKRVVIPN